MKRSLVSLAALAFLIFLVFRVPHFSSVPHPATSYEDAMARFSVVEKSESLLPLSPEGKSRLLAHGKKTPRVFVLLHGLTNCPEQFVPLGRILYESGANVVIPRAKYAGFADRMNEAQGWQSGQDLLDQAALGLDLAAGLGGRVSLVGLSGSGVSAAWMAQNRPGIESVLILSPFFGLHGRPVWLIDALAAILSKLPNFYSWWDPTLKENIPGPPYAYPRYGSRSMADTIQLSRNVRKNMSGRPLKAGRLDILTTATDVGASNALTRQMADHWQSMNPGRVSEFEFPESDGVPHDMVDPHQPDQKIALTYPVILERLGVTASSQGQ